MEEGKINEKEEIVTELIGFSLKKLWHTIVELTVRPGQTIAAYCDGERNRIVTPITYFVLTFGMGFFVMTNTGLMDNSINLGYSLYTGTPERNFESYRNRLPTELSDEEVSKFMDITNSTLAFVTSQKGMLIQIIPVWLLFQWLFFKKYRKPFSHHLYLLMYTGGHSYLLTAPLMIPLFFSEALVVPILTITSLFGIGYYFFAAIKFYPGLRADQFVELTVKQILASIIPGIIWCCLVIAITYAVYFMIIW